MNTLTKKQLATRWDCSERKIERMDRDGTGPRFIRVGLRSIRYPLTEVERWEAERTYTSRAAELAKVAA